MTKMFYSFDDGRLYYLDNHYTVDILMHEKHTQNGVLIYADYDKLELVEYNNGNEVEFDTRFLISLDNGIAVLRKSHIIGNKPKTYLAISKSKAMHAENHVNPIESVGGM